MATSKLLVRMSAAGPSPSPTLVDGNSFGKQLHSRNNSSIRGGKSVDSRHSTALALGPTEARDEQEALIAIKTHVEQHQVESDTSHNQLIGKRNSICAQMNDSGAGGSSSSSSSSKQETRRPVVVVRQLTTNQTTKQNYQSIAEARNQVQPETVGVGAPIKQPYSCAASLCPNSWTTRSLLTDSALALSSRPLKSQTIVMNCLAGALVFAAAVLIATAGNFGHAGTAVSAASAPGTATSPSGAATQSANGQQQQQQLEAANRAALETELETLLEQQHESQDTNSKLLSEAIISRLMLGNLSDSTGPTIGGDAASLPADTMAVGEPYGSQAAEDLSSAADLSDMAGLGSDQVAGADSIRLRKLLSYLRNYELSRLAGEENSGLSYGQVSDQFPVLPASQAATAKRASQKVGNYLRQQQQQQRHLNGYGRSTYDFGLGKRPDASVAGNILRLGDSGAHMQPVSGQLRRPGAHRYDFGLGKRVASPTYPRYDFGLGKRAPSNRIRYDFGLGK